MGPSNPLDPASAPTPQLANAQQGTESPVALPDVISGTNPLTAAANPLLNLIPQIRATVQHADPARLRDFLVEQVQAFELRARSAGIAPEVVHGARYCLCTALDETAAQTPWGGSGAWSRHSLLVTFHNETWGGEKFFQLLSKIAQNPQQHGQLLELMYYCLALGFEGRFRIVDNGRTQLETLRQRLAQIIRDARGEYEQPLSLHWSGAAPAAKRPWEHLPLWVAAAICAVLGLGAYLWFALSLGGQSDDLFASIRSIRAPRVQVVKPAEISVARLKKFLEPEIREGLVDVHEYADRSVVNLRGDGLFDSGSTTVKDRYRAVLTRVATALNDVPGQVVVTGHTDNTRINTIRFPSNFQLSQARADVVKEMLERYVKAPSRIRAEGRADTNPIAANDSPAGRAANRRVEVTLLVAPADGAAPPPPATGK